MEHNSIYYHTISCNNNIVTIGGIQETVHIDMGTGVADKGIGVKENIIKGKIWIWEHK